MLDLTHEPDLGYVFYPNETPDHPGHPRMDVIIPAIATHQHYDLKKFNFKLSRRQKTSNISSYTIPGHWGKSIKFVPVAYY